MTKKLQHLQRLRTRSFDRVPSSVDVENKSFDIIISTETPVRTHIRNPQQPNESASDAYIEVDEVLLASGLDTSRTGGMPLVDGHDTVSGIETILGKVENVRVVGNEVHGTAILNSRNSDLINDIADGHFHQISAGYGVNNYEIEHRDDDVPLAYATSWTLYEASLVAVGADPNASVRSAGRTIPAPEISFRNKPKKAPLKVKNSTRAMKRKLRSKTEKRTMTEDEVIELIEVAEEAMEIVEDAIEAVEEAVAELADDVSDEILERARRLRNEDEEDHHDERRRGKREEEDDEDDEKEKDEIRSIRSIAKSYGLTKAVDDLVALGTRSKDLKASIRSAIMSKAMNNGTSGRSGIEPRPARREAKLTSARDIYAALNKRK